MRFAVHDGPGIRTTVFLKGCPLRCAWCHNPESQPPGPSLMYFEERCIKCGGCAVECAAEARQWYGRTMTTDEVVRDVERDLAFFEESGGGVTLSGGEPLMQPVFTESLLAAFRERSIHTVLDTCGFAPREVCVAVAARADIILYDLKLLDPERHFEYTGVPAGPVLGNLEALAPWPAKVVVRYPVIPHVNDGDADIGALAAFLTRLRLRRIDLLPYHRIGMDKYRRLGLPDPPQFSTPEPERLRSVAARLESAGLEVRMGGSK